MFKSITALFNTSSEIQPFNQSAVMSSINISNYWLEDNFNFLLCVCASLDHEGPTRRCPSGKADLSHRQASPSGIGAKQLSLATKVAGTMSRKRPGEAVGWQMEGRQPCGNDETLMTRRHRQGRPATQRGRVAGKASQIMLIHSNY